MEKKEKEEVRKGKKWNYVRPKKMEENKKERQIKGKPDSLVKR